MPLPQIPAALQADQVLQFLDTLDNTFVHARLALRTSNGDRFRLRRYAKQLGEHLDNLVSISEDHLPNQHVLGLAQRITQLMDTLNELADQSKDTTVTTYLKPLQIQKTGGRPSKKLYRGFLMQCLDLRMGPTAIKEVVELQSGESISTKTIRRQLVKEELVEPWARTLPFTDISDQDLRERVDEWLTMQPACGVNMLQAGLGEDGVHLPRARVEAVLRAVRPLRAVLHPTIYARRDVYWCAGPNSVWHHDGQHGLVNFGIVIHAFVDGYSRTVVSIRASTNNYADTVLDVFREGQAEYGTPSRVRGDRGGENVQVARWMEIWRGAGRGSYLWGVSAHNTRIERLWVDVTRLVGRKWKNLFLDLQTHRHLNKDLDHHKFLLGFLFLADINQDLQRYRRQHNSHKLSTEKNQTPSQLFMKGSYVHGVRGLIDWSRMGPVAWDGEAQVDPITFAAQGERDEAVEDDEVRGQVWVEDTRCPFDRYGWEDELRVRTRSQGRMIIDPGDRWDAGLEAMESMLQDGW